MDVDESVDDWEDSSGMRADAYVCIMYVEEHKKCHLLDDCKTHACTHPQTIANQIYTHLVAIMSHAHSYGGYKT